MMERTLLAHVAPRGPEHEWRRYSFRKENRDREKGGDTKLLRDWIHVLTRYIVGTYEFSLTCSSSQSQDPASSKRKAYIVNFETRSSSAVRNAPRDSLQTWAVHRVTFTDLTREFYPTPSFSSHFVSRPDPTFFKQDTVIGLISAFPFLHIFEFKFGHGEYHSMYYSELLSIVREALLSLPSWRLIDNKTPKRGNYSKVRIVRLGSNSPGEQYGE